MVCCQTSHRVACISTMVVNYGDHNRCYSTSSNVCLIFVLIGSISVSREGWSRRNFNLRLTDSSSSCPAKCIASSPHFPMLQVTRVAFRSAELSALSEPSQILREALYKGKPFHSLYCRTVRHAPCIPAAVLRQRSGIAGGGVTIERSEQYRQIEFARKRSTA